MTFKSRDLMMKLSGAGGQGEQEDTCTKCTDTHDHGGGDGDGDGDGANCEECTMTHPPTGPDKRQALADPALGMLRLQLREALGGDAR
jgi:hypothetical protein